MTEKNTFILYRSDVAAARRLKDKHGADSALEFLFAIAEYGLDQHLLTFADPSAEDAFYFADIQRRVDADIEKYATTVEKRKEAGRKGGIASGESRSKTKQNEANEANASTVKQNEANASTVKQNEANEAVSVSDTVSVSDAVSDTVSESKPVSDTSSSGQSPRTPVQEKVVGKPYCIEEVEEYAKELSTAEKLSGRPNNYYGKNVGQYVEPFFTYWESAGWKRRGGAIKDWKASFRSWCLNEFNKPTKYSNNNNQSDTVRYVLSTNVDSGNAYKDPNAFGTLLNNIRAERERNNNN